MLNVRAVTLIAAAALALPATSLASARTTLPTKTMLIEVFMTDQKALVIPYQGSAVGFLPYVGTIPRGDFLKFNVVNRGKKPHSFSIFGKTVKPVKPGGVGHLFHTAAKRGTFPWTSPLDKGKKGFHGTLIVS